MKVWTHLDGQNTCELQDFIVGSGVPTSEGGIGYNFSYLYYHDGSGAEALATRSYVDDQVDGVKNDSPWKIAATCATTASMTISSVAIGDTIDGHTLAGGDIVLFKDQEGTDGGLYDIIDNEGSTLVQRHESMETSSQFNGAVVTVLNGTANSGTTWRCDNVNPTLGTDTISFSEFGADIDSASTGTAGVVELATVSETKQGTASDKAVTPEGTECFARMVTASISGTSGTIDLTNLSFTADGNAAVVQFYDDNGDLGEVDITLAASSISWSSASSVTGQLNILLPISDEVYSV